ncbi:MAG: DnaB-like helicase C-terminal domain-containing protein [Candidatus Hodarchaeota archaeon]
MEDQTGKLPTLKPEDFIKAITELREIGKHGLKSDLKNIDTKIGGIWRDGVVISGDPGHGKTIFFLNLIFGFLRSENKVIYLDLENDRRDTIKRMILITLNRIFGKDAPTEGQLIKDPTILANTIFWEKIHQYPESHFTLINIGDKKITPGILDNWLKETVREIQQTGKQAILGIDSLNELALVYPLARNIYESLEKWLAEIKLLRVRYQIPIALICHVPKDAPKEIFTPKGSSGIAHFARTQIVIKRPTASTLEANIVRSQFGETGKVLYNFDQMRLGISEKQFPP